jgi:hypothetical protein
MTPLAVPERMPRDLSELPVRVYTDSDRRLCWVPMSMETLPDLLTEWSQPLQVKVIDGQLTFKRVSVGP